MTVYVVANINVHDPEGYKAYSASVSKTVADHGGWYVGRAGAAGDAEIVEGSFQPGRFVILAFESREAAHAWYDSDEYQAAAEIRKACSDGDVFIIDEVPTGAGPTREWGDRR